VNRRRKYGGAGLPAIAASSAVLSTVVLTKVEAASAKEDAAKAGQSQSKWVKPILRVKPVVRIECKSLTMNSLQHKQLQAGHTMFNLVKHGQNKPIHSLGIRAWTLVIPLVHSTYG
jgi:hypothetical protein